MKLKRNEKIYIKDLERQIDYLIAYSPTGEHWKKEYYIRKAMIDSFLNDPSVPEESKKKIYTIQNSIFELVNGIEANQEYIKETYNDYKIKHKILVNDHMTGTSYYI